jgi:hypothetical protein
VLNSTAHRPWPRDGDEQQGDIVTNPIGQLTAADEGFTHQVVETFASVGTSDLAWTEKAKTIADTLHPPGNLSGAARTVNGKLETYATAGCSGCHR